MRRLAAVVGLGLCLAACSQPQYFEMEPTSITLESRGATRTVRAVAKDCRGNVYPTARPTRWESSDEKVATVDGEGKVTAVGSGVATIRAIRGDLEGEVLVDVELAERLVVEPTEVRLQQDGQPFQPKIQLLDSRGRPLAGRLILARCEDEKICVVDGDKKLWPYNPGETIFHLSHDGLTAQVKVVVEPAKRR